MYALPDLVLCLAVLMYVWLLVNVGRARKKYGVSSPAVTGNEDFERVFRAQQNTLENMVMFVPLLYSFSRYVSPAWGALLGLVWVIGRVWYAIGYYAPTGKKRSPGFMLSAFALLLMLLGTLLGIGKELLGL